MESKIEGLVEMVKKDLKKG